MMFFGFLFRQKWVLVLFFIAGFGFFNHVGAQASDEIYFFYGQGCPHCASVEAYFDENNLYEKYPITKKEIYFNRENTVFYNELLESLEVPKEGRGVPTVVIGDKVFIGDTPIIQNFVLVVDEFLATSRLPVQVSEDQETLPFEDKGNEEKRLTIVAVVAAALVDAINPCEFAVLIILMTTILAAGDTKKALRAGLAFAASIFLSYFLMGLGLYQAFAAGGVTLWFYKAIGVLAILIGFFNLKDFFWYGKGFLMEVPLSWRPKLRSLINSVTSPLGAFGIGFLVSLFLLPCTSGPYIVILGMLAKNVFIGQALLYLFMYNLIFVLPMILITLAVYKGFNPAKAEEIRKKRLRLLHLIAGVIMVIMGVAVLMGFF